MMPGELGRTVAFSELLRPVQAHGILSLPGWHVWCGTATRGPDGAYYLLFSRWPEEAGFEAWATHSEIAVAVSDTPDGPYRLVDTVFPRAAQRWDDVTHNPAVVEIGGRYVLYYMGTHGPPLPEGSVPADATWWAYRDNQRIGVAVADHPAGPWTRFDAALLDAGEEGAWDAVLTNNPTATVLADGRVLMMYKGVSRGPSGDVVSAGVAIADGPLGPFVRQQAPAVSGTAVGEDWAVEDPFIWRDGDRLLAVMKDFSGAFARGGPRSLALLESRDGLSWQPCPLPLALPQRLRHAERGIIEPFRLERPQLLLVDGRPIAFLCAVLETPDARAYNAQMLLKT